MSSAGSTPDVRDRAPLAETGHRPWPLPEGAWQWRQSWCDLLFAHWPIAASTVRPLVPPALEIQEFDGTSWIGLVPFRMEGVMRRPLPDLPWISAFPELNLRLYVQHGGRPGVWFLSLDAANWLAVWAARRFFHLPYFLARMDVAEDAWGFRYRSQRTNGPAAFEARYRPTSNPYAATAGTLEHWLTERYCLYSATPRGVLTRTEVHHRQWPLHHADAEITRNTMLAPHGLSIGNDRPLLHFSRRLDVVVWPPVSIT